METENGSIKKGRPTVSCGCLVLVLIGIALLGALARPHHGPTFRGYCRVMEGRARILVQGIRYYVEDHAGTYPATLKDLVKDGICDEGWYAHECIVYLDHGLTADWNYVKNQTKPPVATDILLFSPPIVSLDPALTQWWNWLKGHTYYPSKPVRIVAFNDGTAKTLSEAAFRELLKKTNQVLPETPPAKGK